MRIIGGCVGEALAIVVDIGKTHSKVSLWSRSGTLLAKHSRANARMAAGDTARLDVHGIGEWLVEKLAQFAAHAPQYIVPVAHGAGIAAIVDDRLAFAPLDYEQDLPPALLAEYRAMRGSFIETGSPSLPGGLNLGAQLLWLDRLYPHEMERAQLLPWAQYWAWFLSGNAVSEVTSLGCHTDLWAPHRAGFSALAQQRGWAGRFAPLARAHDTIGTLRPELAQRTGLSPQIKVLAGLHDSNAALAAARGFAQIDGNEATVLSTGTWFVAMRLATPASPTVAEARDCLLNVDPSDRPVPSARFMGGRELQVLVGDEAGQIDISADQPGLLDAVPTVLGSGAMVLPTLAPGSGPFPGKCHAWINLPHDGRQRRCAAALYAALLADASLDLIGSSGRLLIEGRFSRAQVFTRALAALRPDMEILVAQGDADVALGALRLIDPTLRPPGELLQVEPLPGDFATYRAAWLAAIEAGGSRAMFQPSNRSTAP